MSARTRLSRRSFAVGLAALGFGSRASRAQGFAGLGNDASGFAAVVPGRRFSFPADHGPHPDYRIEWWYVTANLADGDGNPYGVQWTLFRQAAQPGPQREGWASQQIWMGHAAVTRADTHRFGETFARGGIGQAGVDAYPFHAWIDSWEMRGLDGMSATDIAPLEMKAAGADFSYALMLNADKPLVLEGNAGYSRKSAQGQASYYYSQPFFTVAGTVSIDVDRSTFCPQTRSPGSAVTVEVGPIVLNEQRAPIVVHPAHVYRFHLADCTGWHTKVEATPPVAVSVHADGLARGTDYGVSDSRLFGAHVGFGFTPSKK